jgi:hypothetical protein
MLYQNVVAILCICWIIGCDSNENPVSDPNNSAPQILAVSVSPDTIIAGKSGLIECKAFDPDNDNLTYKWESPGNINGSGSSIFFTPGSCCGQPIIKVIVEDGKGGRIDTVIQVLTRYE